MSVTTSQPRPPQQRDPQDLSWSARIFGRPGRAPGAMPLEAMEFYSPSQAVIARPPLRLADHIVAIIGTMAISIFVILFVVKVDRIVTGPGKVVSITPETVVQPLNTGIVKTIAVSEGDIVRKGQLLAQLDPTTAVSANTAAMQEVDFYKTEIDRLQAELHQTPYHPAELTNGALVQKGIYAQRAAAREAELRYYQGQIDAQRALVNQANANIRQYAKETGVSVDVEKIRAKLEADAVGSRLDTLAAVSARLESERQVLSWIEQGRSSESNIAALQGQLDTYNQQWFADVSETLVQDGVQLANYQNQLEVAALNYKLVDLRAQEDSIVLAVAPVSVGSVVSAGQTFFTLVPINAPLEVDVQVTGDENGYMEVGQPVNIKFETFPYLRYGMASGTVRTISADSFLTAAGGSPGSTAAGTSSGTTSNSVFTGTNPASAYFYDVRITMDRLSLVNVPSSFHVTPGLSVSADIKVGDRTVIEYFVEKLLPIVYDGLREPN